MTEEICEMCGRKIPPQEQAFVYRWKIVCESCRSDFDKLNFITHIPKRKKPLLKNTLNMLLAR